MYNALRKTVLVIFVFLLVPLVLSSSAEAGYRDRILNPLEVAVSLSAGQTIHVPTTDINLSGAFSVMASYKLARFFNIAFVLTHHTSATAGS